MIVGAGWTVGRASNREAMPRREEREKDIAADVVGVVVGVSGWTDAGLPKRCGGFVARSFGQSLGPSPHQGLRANNWADLAGGRLVWRGGQVSGPIGAVMWCSLPGLGARWWTLTGKLKS